MARRTTAAARQCAALLALLMAAGCGSAPAQPPAHVLVRVEAEPLLKSALQQVKALIYPYDARDEAEVSGAQVFRVTGRTQSSGDAALALPFSFGIVQQRADRFILVIKGYATRRGDAQPVIEQKLRVRFQTGNPPPIQVTLSDACYRAARRCDGLDQTCDHEGQCAALPQWPQAERVADAGSRDAAGSAPADADANANADAMLPADRPLDAGPIRSDAAQVDAAGPGPAHSTDLDADGGSTTPVEGAVAPPALCPADHGCSVAYPCSAGQAGAYRCVGQFADWPMPDAASGAKVAPSYDTASIAGVVIDRVTGLMWQRQVPTIYEGCSGKMTAASDACTQSEAARYCSGLELNDWHWRLPSMIELQSIADESTVSPSLAKRSFAGPLEEYWSASPSAAAAIGGWVVRSFEGSSRSVTIDEVHLVRCVHSPPPQDGTPADRYQLDTATDSVTDRRTGLVWQRSATTWSGSWREAVNHCTSLGGGLRLPLQKELMTLVDPTRTAPASDASFQMISGGAVFLSASELPSDSSYGYVVDFRDGRATDGEGIALRIRAGVGTEPVFQLRCVH